MSTEGSPRGRYALLALVVIAAVGIWLLAAQRRPEHRSATADEAAPAPPPAPLADESSASGGRPGLARGDETAGSGATSRTPPGAKPIAADRAITIVPEQVMARVNGVPIYGRDVVPFLADGPRDQSLPPELLATYLERAIDRELVLQDARARHVELDARQAAMVADVREQAMARGVADEAALHFEQNEARINLLQSAMLAERGVPSIFPTDAEVQSYYEAHRDEFRLPSPSKDPATQWKEVQGAVRGRLAMQRQAAYAAQLRSMLDGLRGHARIDRELR